MSKSLLLAAVFLALTSPLSAENQSKKPQIKESKRPAGQFLIEQMPLPSLPPMPVAVLDSAVIASSSFHRRRTRLRRAAPRNDSLAGTAVLERAPAILSQTAGKDPDAKEEMILSPRRFLQRTDRVPENVIVLGREKLKNLPANDPSEALTYLPSIDVTPRTKFGHFTPLSIQGSESRHVLVMVDGIPFNTQASGQADILPALSLTPLERIEVIQGAASSAWGSGLGGVVHLITKDPASSVLPKGSVSSAWSEFREQTQSVEAGGLAGNLGYYFSGDYREAGGSRTKGGTGSREDTLQKKAFGKFVYRWTDLVKLTSSFGTTGAEVNEGIYPSDGTFNEVPYDARYGQVRLEADPGDSRHVEAALKMNRQFIRTDNRDGLTQDLYSSTKVQDHYYGAEVKSVTKFRQEDTFVAAYDVSTTVLKTNLMAVSRDVLVQAPYGSYNWVQGPLELVAGARYDANREYGGQFNPSFGAVYQIQGDHPTTLRVNAARAFSAPPLLWKYFEDIAPGLTVNNPDLRAERAWVYETGADTQVARGFRVGARVFRSDISDAITTVSNDDGFYMKQNFNRFRSQGFEWHGTAQVDDRWTVSFAALFNDVQNRATRLTVQNRGVSSPGFRIETAYRAPGDLQFQLFGRYDRWDSSSALQPNDRKFIFDGRISKRISGLNGLDLTAFLNAFNLTNSKYWMASDFPLPERYFEGGMTVEF